MQHADVVIALNCRRVGRVGRLFHCGSPGSNGWQPGGAWVTEGLLQGSHGRHHQCVDVEPDDNLVALHVTTVEEAGFEADDLKKGIAGDLKKWKKALEKEAEPKAPR